MTITLDLTLEDFAVLCASFTLPPDKFAESLLKLNQMGLVDEKIEATGLGRVIIEEMRKKL